MRRLAALVLAAMLAVPGPVGAKAPVTIREGDSFVFVWGIQDEARVTILDIRTMRTAAGLGTAPTGRRWYMLRVRYGWRKGRPVSGQFDWYPSGGRLRVSGTGARARLPLRVLTRVRPTATGWMAWQGPATTNDVRITALSNDPRYVIRF